MILKAKISISLSKSLKLMFQVSREVLWNIYWLVDEKGENTDEAWRRLI